MEKGGPALEQLGYHFSLGGEEDETEHHRKGCTSSCAWRRHRLVSSGAGEPYAFISSGHHEVVGAAVARHIQHLMTRSSEFGPLRETWLPLYETDSVASTVLARLALDLPASSSSPPSSLHQLPKVRVYFFQEKIKNYLIVKHERKSLLCSILFTLVLYFIIYLSCAAATGVPLRLRLLPLESAAPKGIFASATCVLCMA